MKEKLARKGWRRNSALTADLACVAQGSEHQLEQMHDG